MIGIKLKVENLGNLLYLKCAFGIDTSSSYGYNKAKDNFSKKEGTAEITSAAKANIRVQGTT